MYRGRDTGAGGPGGGRRRHRAGGAGASDAAGWSNHERPARAPGDRRASSSGNAPSASAEGAGCRFIPLRLLLPLALVGLPPGREVGVVWGKSWNLSKIKFSCIFI